MNTEEVPTLLEYPPAFLQNHDITVEHFIALSMILYEERYIHKMIISVGNKYVLIAARRE